MAESDDVKLPDAAGLYGMDVDGRLYIGNT